MKPILSKTKLLALLAVLSGTAVNAGDLPVSPTSGVIRVTPTASATTALAVPFAKSIPFEGTISAVSGTTLTLSTTTLTASALVGYSIYIPTNINGAAAIGASAYGRLVRITANTTDSVTTEVAITPTVGDAFQIIEPHTLGSLFGSFSGTTITLLQGTTSTVADTVFVESSGTFTGYFHRTNQGWRKVSDPNGANQNDVKIDFGRGVLVARKGGSKTVNITGESLTGTFRPYSTPSGATTCINNPFTVATTLAASGLNANLTRLTSASTSDVIYLENNGIFTGYWCRSGTNNWFLESDSSGTGATQNNVTIAPGKAVLFKDRGAGTFNFSFPQPFNS